MLVQQQAAAGQVAHQRAGAIGPRGDAVAGVDAVGECTERAACDTVTMSPTSCVKPWPGPCRSCVGANMVPRNSTKPSGYWWLAPHRLRHQVERIAADHRERARALHHEAVGPAHLHRQVAAAHVGDAELAVEQADERADGAAAVVVLGLAQQQGAAAFEVAQVDVVAQRRALRPGRGCRRPARSRARGCSRRWPGAGRSRRRCPPRSSAATW